MTLAPASSRGVDLSTANTWPANQTAPAWVASGLTGATAASRYVGATASAAPASGTFAVGDFVIDQTGKVFVCTVGGSPGTWTQVGAAGGVTVLNYTTFTSNVTISATSAASATTIVTASGTVTVDGSTLITVEFYAYSVGAGGSSTTNVDVWQGSTDLGVLGAVSATGADSFEVPVWTVRRFTPTAGTYTYSIRGWRTNANATVRANVGGAGFPMPGYIRITSGA